MNYKKIIFTLFFSSIFYQNIQPMLFHIDRSNEPEIFNLLHQNDYEALKNYLTTFRPDLNNIFNNQDRTPLQEAVTLYNLHFQRAEKKAMLKKIIKTLLTYGANVNARPRRTNSPVEMNEELFIEIFSEPDGLSWETYLPKLNNPLAS